MLFVGDGWGGPLVGWVRKNSALLILLAALCAVSAFYLGSFKLPNVHLGDSPAYLTAAYNIAHYGVVSETPAPHPAPSVGREPGYAALLAALMKLDPNGFGSIRPDCFLSEAGCGDVYLTPRVANVVMLALAALCMFALVLVLAPGARVAAAIAGAYVGLNVEAASTRHYVMSDCLALFVMCVTMLAGAWAWRGGGLWRAMLAGLALGALALVKAVFAIYGVLLIAVALLAALLLHPGTALRGVAAFALVFVVLAGGWTARNALVGAGQIADERPGITLAAREGLMHMRADEYAAAFVYWTGGVGDDWAEAMFAPETLHRFHFSAPDGFFAIGQFGFGRRVEARMAETGVSRSEAVRAINGEIIGALLTHPLAYAASMAPVFYHGLWGDQFILLGFPALIWATFAAWRRRDWLLGALLSAGWFNLFFYAAISTNEPRYQMTAVPALALAAAMAWLAWRRGRGCLRGAPANQNPQVGHTAHQAVMQVSISSLANCEEKRAALKCSQRERRNA